jgi:hypothetical protein
MTAPARPRPILDAIRSGGVLISAAGSVLGALVAVGLLTATQANAVTVILGAVATLLPGATAAAAQLHVLTTAEPRVTPLSSPQDSDGTELVRPLAAPPKATP